VDRTARGLPQRSQVSSGEGRSRIEPLLADHRQQLQFLVAFAARRCSEDQQRLRLVEVEQHLTVQLRVEGRLLNFGMRGSVVDTVLYSDGFAEPVTQGVVTYVPLFPATD
jgi:hypothetical protein